jgi:purine-nucleoside phosphorylase
MKTFLEAINYLETIRSWKPDIGIILGTGLGGLAEEISILETISYTDIPHFPVSTVESHKGKFLFAEFEGKKLVVMQGRFHYYEGYSLEEVVFPIRIMKLLGIKSLFLSNAAGGLNPEQEISDLMIIDDHINLIPDSPLRGKQIDEFGPRFPDLFEAYTPELIKKGLRFSSGLGVGLHKGTYAAVPGPNLETPAEYKYLRSIGADAVGMSTIPEVIAGVQMGIKNIFAVSVITDLGIPGKIKRVTIEEVLKAAGKAEPHLTALMKEMIGSVPTN